MRDGRNGGGRKKAPVREFEFAWIERDWRPSPLSAKFIERDGNDYVINILMRVTLSPPGISVDHFRIAADGTILSAPRGSAKDYKPGRITDIAEAYAKYAGGASE